MSIAMLLPLLVAAGEPTWDRGTVRELFISGLPQTPDDLAGWVKAGVNCFFGLKPEQAEQAGALSRGWFTLNYMDSRGQDEAWITARAAVREDGSYLRPYDPLFPTVGQYGWSACINNPLWVEHAREHFRNLATAGHDGVHVDYASHYEPCFCGHCRAAWATFAAARGVSTDLSAASHAEDRPTRMAVREFRIRSVMGFLADLRATARAIRPGFGLDGTWHQDSGSTYQWAYGDHFDLMCIEGTTHGPFPPDGTQLPWLKLAHALSRRADRRPVAMSVTYHLLTDDRGTMHHGRMAGDRLKVAMAEIVSQGGVSWLGLGGPGTGSLIREHVDAVRGYLQLAAELAPILSRAEEVGEVGVVFSARSYLLTGAAHRQLYALTQAMMKAHLPYRIVGDVGLRAEDLAGLSGVILTAAPALSDAACAALDRYVRDGGRLLVIGGDAGTVTEDWRDRGDRPEVLTAPSGDGELTERELGRGSCRYWVAKAFEPKAAGANQRVVLDQTKPVKLAVEGWSKADNVTGQADANYSLYVDLLHQDGSPMWGRTATFRTATHDWQFSRCVIESERPFKSASIHLLFRHHGGTAWFKDVRFGVWDEQRQQIVENLLRPVYRQPDGSLSGGTGDGPVWEPYGGGFTLENMLDLGLWLKVGGEAGIDAYPLCRPLNDPERSLLSALEPLRAKEPLVEVTGAGADMVSVDLQRAGDELLVQVINHAAELHPELPEAEQQAREHGLPARDLVVTVGLPGRTLDAGRARLLAPDGSTGMTEQDGPRVRLRLAELRQYAALLVPSRPR